MLSQSDMAGQQDEFPPLDFDEWLTKPCLYIEGHIFLWGGNTTDKVVYFTVKTGNLLSVTNLQVLSR